MCRGKICFIAILALALHAAEAARTGLETSAALTAWPRKCQDIKKTLTPERLRVWGLRNAERCYCGVIGRYPSRGCGEFEEVEVPSIYTKGKFMTFHSFRLADAARSCECLTAFEKSQEQPGDRKCRDIKGTATSEKLKEEGVIESEGMCYCSFEKKSASDEYPSDGCGEVEEVKDAAGYTWRSFRLDADTSPGCKCLNARKYAAQRSRVVEAAAVRFCTAVVAEMHRRFFFAVHSAFLKENGKELGVTPQVCQEVLTGTLDDVGTRQSKALFHDFHEANALSKHNGTKGMGRLDPLVTEGFTASMEHQKLLQHVCQDECNEIVNEIQKNIVKMHREDFSLPFEDTCADNVVRKVEAEMLGCCGRSCGWNGRSCMSWPFLAKGEKVEWLQQCCGEFNVLQNSTRERMCNSVLSPRQVRLVSKFDTKPKQGDVGGAYMGQDPRLLWAKPGLEKFRKERNRFKQKPKENQPVTSDFLEKHPDVYKEGLKEGWFREEKDPEEMSSLAEIGASTCHDLQKTMQKMQRCSPEMQRQARETCLRQEGWQASAKPEKEDLDDEDDEPTCQEKMIDPNLNTPTKVATPDECLEVNFTDIGETKRMFFVYDTANPDDIVLEKPILCFPEKPIECDFEEGRKVSEIEFNRDKGFADYIYWIDLPEKKKSEGGY